MIFNKIMKKNTDFGAGSMGYDNGYNLPLLTSWIENLTDEEGEKSLNKKYQLRFQKVQQAVQLLNDALEIE
jgi:hypothetical protein